MLAQSNAEVPRFPIENLAKKSFRPELLAPTASPSTTSVTPYPQYSKIRGMLIIENRTNIQKNAFMVIRNRVGPNPISFAVGVTHLDFKIVFLQHGM